MRPDRAREAGALQTVAECIHGFEPGFCDICFPRARPEPVVPAVATKAAPRTTSVRTRRTPGAAAPSVARIPPFALRRLHHVTHLGNLERILLDGAIRSVGAGARPDVDVSAPLVRELRATAETGTGRAVDEFVPFSLTPDADRWVELRDGATGSHWSAAAKEATATEYVILVAAADRVGADVVIAEGDASAPATRFTAGDPASGVSRAVRDDPELARVEVLVADRVPLDALLLIGVPNEPVRARVRHMIDATGAAQVRVVVHPPWFAPSEL